MRRFDDWKGRMGLCVASYDKYFEGNNM